MLAGPGPDTLREIDAVREQIRRQMSRSAEQPELDLAAREVAAMEELGHRFFVFVDAETERIAILYARDDGHYGLIEPVVGGEYTTGRAKGR